MRAAGDTPAHLEPDDYVAARREAEDAHRRSNDFRLELRLVHGKALDGMAGQLCSRGCRDDLVQHTIERLPEKIDLIDIAEHSPEYIRRAAWRQMLNFLRSCKACGGSSRVTQVLAGDVTVLSDASAARVSAGPEDATVDELLFEEHLGRVSGEEADVMTLRYRYGYSQTEVAKITNRTRGKVIRTEKSVAKKLRTDIERNV